MKPKLWDGANAVGEAKARALKQVDAPYLTATGPGFTARKMGEFSEVTGETSESTAQFVEGSWVAISDAFFDPIVVTSSSSYRKSFQKLRVIPQGGDWQSWIIGANIACDGRGKALVSTYSFSTALSDVHSTYSFGRTGALKELFQFETALDAVGGHAYGGDDPRRFRAGLRNEYFHDGGVTYAISAATDQYWHADGWPRTKAAINVAAKNPGGAWGTAKLLCPVETDIAEDTAHPCLAILGTTTIAVLYSHAPTKYPVMHVSDDLGQTWGAAVSTRAVWEDRSLMVFGNGTPCALNMLNPPFSEQWYREESGVTNPVAQRDLFIGDNMNIVQLFGALGAPDLATIPVSASKVAVATGITGTAQGGTIVAVIDVYTGGVSARAFFENKYWREVVSLGRGSWVVALSDTTMTYFYYYTDPAIYTFTFMCTTDFGQTYTPLALPPGAVDAYIFPITPYDTPEGDYLIGYTVLEGGDRVLYTSDDKVTFKKRGVIGHAANLERAMWGKDYTTVVDTGTRMSPRPIYPAAPWTRESKYPTPAWWNE